MNKIITKLNWKNIKQNKIYEDDFCIVELIPRRKGIINGSQRKDGQPKQAKYSKRIKFTPKRLLKDRLCE